MSNIFHRSRRPDFDLPPPNQHRINTQKKKQLHTHTQEWTWAKPKKQTGATSLEKDNWIDKTKIYWSTIVLQL